MLIIAHTHRGENHTHIQCKLFSENNNTLDKRAARRFVGKGDKTVSEFDLDRLNVK